FAVALWVTLFTASAQAQGNAEIIRGRVFSPDSTPMAGIVVTVTGLMTRTEHKVKTNKDGVYTTLFSQGDGEYVVAARALGYRIQRQRVTKPQTGNVFVADIAMSAVANALDTITVRGARSRVARTK